MSNYYVKPAEGAAKYVAVGCDVYMMEEGGFWVCVYSARSWKAANKKRNSLQSQENDLAKKRASA